MERIEISTGKIDWPEIVRHVAHDRVSVELSDGLVPIARLIPVEKPNTMADLDRSLRELPRLGDDAAAFKSDIESARSQLGKLDNRWES